MALIDRLTTGLDAALEFSVVGSFSRLGPAVRRRLFSWEPLSDHRMEGQVAAITGATSGLGLVAATEMARLGSRVLLLVRDPKRGRVASARITAATGNEDIAVVVVDLGDMDSIRRAAIELQEVPAIDVLVHNAGALHRTRQVSPQGVEQTVASQVIGPFLLTHLLGHQLRKGRSRVIFVASGGMYTQPLAVARLEMSAGDYDGVVAYARAKRAQVSLVQHWAPRLERLGITMVAMHPGWADTPGVRASLPTFHRVARALLRSPMAGADTTVWLASNGDVRLLPGSLWLDRRRRSPHRLSRTRRTDTAAERAALWFFCRDYSAIGEPELAALS